MTTRDTLAYVARQTRSMMARSTARKYDDHNLVQETDVDVHHSETHTGIERIQPVGLTAVPLKQDETQQQQQAKSTGSDRFNHNQPTGDAAEMFIGYMNGNHSHPVVMASDDYRVRPYDMKEGENALYHAAGSEQMVFMNDAGAYLVSLDGKSVKNKDGNETRMASLRHVTKDMQTHQIEENSEAQDYKHEGKTVNTEVRCTASRIEFRSGDTVVGYYDKAAETWYFKGKVATMEFSEKVETTAPKVSNVVSSRFETVGKTYLGLDSKDEAPPLGETGDTAYKQTYVKLVT